MTPANTPSKNFQLMTSDTKHVEQLNPRFRELLNLRYVDLKTHKAIAEELDIAIGSVKSGLHRACAQVRKLRAEAACQSS
jgi:DNA-directed RNA polymerase specialized sigma24 family protein